MATQPEQPALVQTPASALSKTSQRNKLSTNEDATTEVVATQDKPAMQKTWRFWAIIASLMITSLMSALEGTIITSALPTITEALGGGEAYIWVPNAFLLSSVAVIPLFAGASNIFGRRNLLLGAVAIFTLGSGLCGGASSMNMLIAARTVQGFGGGGMNLLVETVVTDLVPLRERGKYMSIVYLGATVGATLGPFLGGVITDQSSSSWRWCFYLNVPIGGGKLLLIHCNFSSTVLTFVKQLPLSCSSCS
jgi:MFS family permease